MHNLQTTVAEAPVPTHNTLIKPADKVSQDQFLYNVTHDMKAGLRALTELPTWVEDDLTDHNISLPRGVREHLDLMRQNALGLSTLLDGLVDLYRAGQTPDAPRRTTVEQAARRAWESVAKDAGFKIETHNALDTIYLPDRTVTSLFKAILENTVHHHEGGRGFTVVTSETIGNRVHIRIEDNGPGIPETARDHVCEALVMLRRREETGRAGLGLTLAKKLITKLNGTLTLTDASSGRGLAVLFDVPVRARW